MVSYSETSRSAKLLLGLCFFFLSAGCSGLGSSNIMSTEGIKKKENVDDFYCLTDVFVEAENCAFISIEEFSGLLKKTGDYDRLSAYLLLLSGTASAIGEAFDMDEDVLKSAAVLAGSVIGARTISGPDVRREVLSRGLIELTCALRVAQAANSTEIKDADFGGFLNFQNADGTDFKLLEEKRTTTLYGLSRKLASQNLEIEKQRLSKNQKLREDAVFLAAYDATRGAMAFVSTKNRGDRLKAALTESKQDAGSFLSASVIEIRASVRKGLSGGIPNLDDLAKNQKERIDGLIKDAIEESEDPPPPELLFDAANIAPALVSESRQLQANASKIRAAYKACVGEP